jgi:PAS domain S-box-containing protein
MLPLEDASPYPTGPTLTGLPSSPWDGMPPGGTRADGPPLDAGDVAELKRSNAILAARARLSERSPLLTLEQLLRATLDEAEALTSSCIGFYHFMESDQQTLHLQAWSSRTEAEFCRAEGKGSHYPIAQAGVWADCLRERRSIIHNDYATLPNRKGLPPGHAAVTRELTVPVLRSGRIVAVLGVGNKTTDYHEVDVDTVQRLADLAWDLAETKRAQMALQESEERYRRITEGLSDYQYRVLVEQGRAVMTTHSLECQAVTGYTEEDYASDPYLWFNMIAPADREAAQTRFEKVLLGQEIEPFEHRIFRKDGSLRWVSDTILLNKDSRGVLRSYDGIVEDITQRKLAELALAESEEKFRTLADFTYDWERWDDPHGTILYCSPSCERITGYPAEAFLADPGLLQRLLHPEDLQRWQAHCAAAHFEPKGRAEEAACVRETDFRLLHRNGEVRWIGHICQPVFGTRGTFKGVRISNRDLTERKRLETQLHQSQKMEGLGLLAGGVAHDMNNVLGAILGLASVHLEVQPADSPAHRAFLTILKACDRGRSLIQRLLGFARQGLAEERVQDLNALIRDEVRLLERTTLAQVRLQMDLAADLRPIRGDSNALSQALMNLCVNAVDAMPESGTLTLRTRNVDAGWVEVHVEDTGSGMTPEVLEKALDPFFTTKAHGKGTGLGLPLTHTTVVSHRGQMEILSEPGHGTRVLLRFPTCEPSPVEPETRAASRKEPSRVPLKVLLVDDDELIQNSMQAVLEILGHTVAPALSGEEALACLEAGFQPDLVILDMNMPGLGGAGTLPRLRALRPTVPVLLATGRADQTALNLVEAHPGVTLLSKPFGMKELQQQLEQVRPAGSSVQGQERLALGWAGSTGSKGFLS